jgi:uncharacterized protein (DUF488 family)
MTTRPRQISTIGHSNHPIDRFIDLLRAHEIEAVVDVRAFPGSRRNPQFNKDALSRALRLAGITYHHMVSLGGFRKPVDAPEETGFSAYIRYTKTEDFQLSIDRLKEITLEQNTTIMCAEALWCNCHRQYVAAAMANDGFAVIHIMDEKRSAERDRSPTLPGL